MPGFLICKSITTVALILSCIISVVAQEHEDIYKFGKVSYKEMQISTYEKDTSASAVIIQEFGESMIDNNNDHNLLLTYYVKIKILKKSGLDEANISVMLAKNEGRYERIKSTRASSFNIENGSLKETKLNPKSV